MSLGLVAADSVRGGNLFHDQERFVGLLGYASNPCGDPYEPIEITGTMHTVIHVTHSVQGTSFVLMNTQWANVTGTNLVTGEMYRFISTSVYRDDVNGAPASGTVMSQQRMISYGSSSSWYLRLTVHGTLDANGEPHAVVGILRTDCSGSP